MREHARDNTGDDRTGRPNRAAMGIAADDICHPVGPSQQLADLADRVLELHEELRKARNQLASYSDTLVAIQRSILPQQLPSVPGLDLAVHFADVGSVGGDFYDVHPVGPDRWAILIADVAGHGLAAAAILALVHALSSTVQGQEASPGRALALVNEQLATRYFANTSQFVTVFAGLYCAQTQTLTYAAAGHPPPRLVRGNEVRRLGEVSGWPLGISRLSEYPEQTVQLVPGDRLVLYTDGITESKSATRELFGDERLDIVLRAPRNTAAGLLEHVVGSVQEFRAGQAAEDDETCLVAVVTAIREHFRKL